MANRLSEDTTAPVLIIERGCSVLQNPLVYNTSAYGAAFRSAIDYAYHSAPQVYMGNKVLGGTTTINGMSHTRAEDVQINAWQTKLVAGIGMGLEPGDLLLTTRTVGTFWFRLGPVQRWS
jgi:choline dehydrogenase-like flavoprotein